MDGANMNLHLTRTVCPFYRAQLQPSAASLAGSQRVESQWRFKAKLWRTCMTQANSQDDKFPSEPLDLTAEDGFFPRRQPGEFPAVAVRKTLRSRLASAVGLESALGGSVTTVDTSASADAAAAETSYDPLRDGPLRYLGYSNELGEAFAAWLPLGGVPASYGVAITYVLVDTYDKFAKARTEARNELDGIDLDPSVRESRLVALLASERALDTVVWQMLASVALPGFTIHTIVGLMHKALDALESTQQLQAAFLAVAPSMHMESAALAAVFDKSLPTLAGLAAIPFIVHPIDEAVHAVMNVSMRPAVKKLVCGAGGGSKAGLALCADCTPADAGSDSSGKE